MAQIAILVIFLLLIRKNIKKNIVIFAVIVSPLTTLGLMIQEGQVDIFGQTIINFILFYAIGAVVMRTRERKNNKWQRL